MKNIFKTALRTAAAIAVCAALGACGQVGSSAGNFPSYSAQSSVAGHFVPPDIMDY